MDDDVDRWRALWAEPVTGWDFGRFGDRLVGAEPPWAYDELAREVLREAHAVVDLGTGGGEVLLGLADALPPDTTATEGWAPNQPVASAALAPFGIEVVAYDAEVEPRMPFPDARFDVVLDRHEAYDAREVARVLRPTGAFLTQQVDGRDLADLDAVFGTPPSYPTVTLAAFRAEAEAAGLVVELAEEWSGDLRFADVDTLVSYLAMVPWQAPDDFTVDEHADALRGLARSQSPLMFTQRRFVLRARRPG